MRLVGITRVLDEADIVEAFIRHHASLLDGMIVLDGGSSDGTVDILRALRAEGLALKLYQASSPVFVEALHNTGLYRLAMRDGADWVLPLDADELLVVAGERGLREVLALAPEGVPCLRLDSYCYAPGPAPEHPLAGLTRREAAPHMHKVVVRRLPAERINLYAGNHGAYVDGVFDAGLSQDRLSLAHVPFRSKLQQARKLIFGQMKVIASGAAIAEAATSHTRAEYLALKADPRRWLEQGVLPEAGLVADPVAYRGGALRYTPAADPLATLLALFAARGEQLARSHGDILDRKRLVRAALLEQARHITPL